MYCEHCGQEVEPGNPICPFCGAAIPQSLFADAPDDNFSPFDRGEDESETKGAAKTLLVRSAETGAKIPRPLVMILLPFAIVLIALAIDFVLAYTSPLSRIVRALRSNNINQALQIYKAAAIKPDSPQLQTILTHETQYIYQDFMGGHISYEKAVTALDHLRLFNSHAIDSQIGQIKKDLSRYGSSRQAFQSGNDYFQKEEYVLALKSYQKVIQGDWQYGKAQEQIALCQKKISALYIKRALDLIKAEKYDEALEILNSADPIVAHYPALVKLREDIERLRKDSALRRLLLNAQKMADSGKPGDAAQLLEAEKEFQDEPAFTEALKKYRVAFDEQVADKITDANALSYSGRYRDALDSLREDPLIAARKDVQSAVDSIQDRWLNSLIDAIDKQITAKKYDNALEQIKSARSIFPSSETLARREATVHKLILAAITPTPSPLPTPGPHESIIIDEPLIPPITMQVVSTDGLNLRKGPGIQYSVIASLNYRAQVLALFRRIDKSGDGYWYYVDWNGQYGWLKGNQGGATYLRVAH